MAHGRSRSLRSFAFGSSKRNTSPSARSPSPTFSDATHASAMNFGNDGPQKIITRANLKASLQAYEDLMTASASYRAALLTMSQATATFASAMDTCAGMKGPSYEAGTRLQAASGLHHLIGNHWHVLAETLDKNFEKPLRQHLDTYRTIVTERSASYEKALQEKSQIIRRTEMGNMNKKERNLQSFRQALNVLQRQVDELDDLKSAHYTEIMDHEEEVWDVVQGKVCVVVRSTMDVFDRFTAKASDPIIEVMLQSVPDPFDSYGVPSQSEDQIFSILPPLSIMNSVASASPSPLTATPERETIEGLPSLAGSRRSSWVPTTGYFNESSSEWADAPSPISTPPRSVSPTSMARGTSSSPPGNGHQPRKSESKLRSMLAVIDETRSRPTEMPLAQPLPAAKTSLMGANTNTTNWQQTFNYGGSPYADTNGEETPRNSALFSQQQTMLSPDSDETVDARPQLTCP